MHRLLERLHRDHRNLLRLLDLLERQLNAFYEGEEFDFDLTAELLEYIECYSELVHHPTEDLIFAAARERAGDLAGIFERLHSQHDSLVGFTRTFRQSLEGIMQGAVMTRQELEIEGRQFIALQREHLNIEEGELFPRISAMLTDQEWDRIEQDIPKYNDPVFGDRDPNRFRILYQYVSEHPEGEGR